MFVLTKFFPQEQYRKEFLNGNLYLSSMSEYTKVYAERGLMAAVEQGNRDVAMLLERQHNNDQMDIFEGTIAGFPKDQVDWLPEDLKKQMASEVKVRAVGYNYSNLMCFCKMYYEYGPLGSAMTVSWNEPDMHSFGEYAVIIKDQNEFMRRINASSQKEGFRFLCGPISYHPLKEEGRKVIGGSMIHLCRDDVVDMTDVLQDKKYRKYDAFDKWDKFERQNEWRLVVDKGEKIDGPIRIQTENLSDIAVAVHASDLAEAMNQLFKKGEIKRGQEGFFGNVGRREMRDNFYQRGDCKAHYFITIGKFEYE